MMDRVHYMMDRLHHMIDRLFYVFKFQYYPKSVAYVIQMRNAWNEILKKQPLNSNSIILGLLKTRDTVNLSKKGIHHMMYPVHHMMEELKSIYCKRWYIVKIPLMRCLNGK